MYDFKTTKIMTKGDDDNDYNDDNWRWRSSGLRRITSARCVALVTVMVVLLATDSFLAPRYHYDHSLVEDDHRVFYSSMTKKSNHHHHYMADNWVWFFPDKISLHRNCFRFISTWMAHWKWETIFSLPNLSTPCQILRAGASNYYETVHQMTKAMKDPISTLKSWLNLQRSPLLVKPVK